MRLLCVCAILLMCAAAFGAEHALEVTDAEPHPVLSHDSSWVPVMLMVMGVVIAGILLSIYLPLIKSYGMQGR